MHASTPLSTSPYAPLMPPLLTRLTVPSIPPAPQLLARHGLPLFGVEQRRPLGSYDVLGFSLAYELGGTNALEMMHLAGIPVSWKVCISS